MRLTTESDVLMPTTAYGKLMLSSSFSEINKDESTPLTSMIFSIKSFLWTTIDLLLEKELLAELHCLFLVLWIFFILLMAKLFNLESWKLRGVLGFAETVPFFLNLVTIFFLVMSSFPLLSKIRNISFVMMDLSLDPYLNSSSNLPSYFYLLDGLDFLSLILSFLCWVDTIDITTCEDRELLLDFFNPFSYPELEFFSGFRAPTDRSN